MKINDQINKSINPGVEKLNSTVKTQSNPLPIQNSVLAKNDPTTATISSTLQSIQSLVSSGPVFDAKKVEILRNEIESGKFIVNTDKVADNLISHSISALKTGNNT